MNTNNPKFTTKEIVGSIEAYLFKNNVKVKFGEDGYRLIEEIINTYESIINSQEELIRIYQREYRELK